MHEIFGGIVKHISEGNHVALVTEYSEALIHRSVVCEDDIEWNALDAGSEGVSLTSTDDRLVMVEYYSPKPRMIILGGGHIAVPLCQVGAILGFSTVVYDDRPSFANNERFPDAETVICDSFDHVADRVRINKNDYVVIVTRGHRHDGQCLRSILDGVFPKYVGMIGSRRRVAIVKEQLEEETGETEKLARLHAPIGLSIGAETPQEIAVSIIAEIIKEMRVGPPAIDARNTSKPQCFNSLDMELFEWLSGEGGKTAALATVVYTEGSTPRETGAKMAILPHGKTIGSIGGGCAEADVVQKSISIVRDGGYCLMDVDLTDSAEEDGMVCGGLMKVLVEAVH